MELEPDGKLDTLIERTNAPAWLAGDGAGGREAPQLIAEGCGRSSFTSGSSDGDRRRGMIVYHLPCWRPLVLLRR